MNVYSVSTLAYRQTPEHRAALELPQHARRPGRYHDRGDPSPLYASSTPEAAMSEFLRQVARGDLTFVPDDVRRLSTLELPTDRLLDLMDPEVCSAEGITYAQLIGEDTSITRALAQRMTTKGTVIGLRAPSAALRGAITFVIFGRHLEQVVLREEHTVRIVDYLDPPPDHRSASRSAP
jgi:RES domain-containing protein